MELRLNGEGEQYLIGVPLNDRPELFSQVVLQPGELDCLPADYTVTASTRQSSPVWTMKAVNKEDKNEAR